MQQELKKEDRKGHLKSHKLKRNSLEKNQDNLEVLLDLKCNNTNHKLDSEDLQTMWIINHKFIILQVNKVT